MTDRLNILRGESEPIAWMPSPSPLSLSPSRLYQDFLPRLCSLFPHFSVLKIRRQLSLFLWFKAPSVGRRPPSRDQRQRRHSIIAGGLKIILKLVWMESTSPSNSLIGYSLKWRCCSLVWSKSLSSKTDFDCIGRDQSSFKLSALIAKTFLIFSFHLSKFMKLMLFSFSHIFSWA